MSDTIKKYENLILKRKALEKTIGKYQSKVKAHYTKMTIEMQDAITKGSTIDIKNLSGYHAKNTAIKGYQKKINKSNEEIKKIDKDFKSIKTQHAEFSNYSSDYNFMLMPVKLQTKVVTYKHIVKIQDIDSIEEHSSTKDYEKNLDEKIASTDNYSGFVPSSLANRNTNTTTYPVVKDTYELWVRIYPDDIHTYTHEEKLSRNEIDLAETFYKELHNTNSPDQDEKQTQLKQWKKVVDTVGIPRALYIISKCKPSNDSGNPEFKKTDKTSVKEKNWSKAPCAIGLPDQFTIRLYKNNKFSEHLCNPLPLNENNEPCLFIGADPSNESLPFQITDNGIVVDEKLKWLSDFDSAVAVGMGIKIKLTEEDVKSGFNKLVALGVRNEKDTIANKWTIEELFKNHSYKSGGLSFLDIGTPTNNTEFESSGTSVDDLDVETSFNLLHQKIILKNTVSDFLEHASDAHRLAVSIGIDTTCFNHALSGNNNEISNATAFNRALSFGTLGYGISQFFIDHFKGLRELNEALGLFNAFVLGRGNLPTIRIGTQPYGFLPICNYSKLKLDNNDSTLSNNLVSLFINYLNENWYSHLVTSRTKKISKNNTDDGAFKNFLSANATSIGLEYTGGVFKKEKASEIVRGYQDQEHSLNPNDIPGLRDLSIYLSDNSSKQENSLYFSMHFSEPTKIFGSLVKWDKNIVVPDSIDNYLKFFIKKIKNNDRNGILDIDLGNRFTYDKAISDTNLIPHAPLLFLYLRFTILRAMRFDDFHPDPLVQNIALHDISTINEDESKDDIINTSILNASNVLAANSVKNQINSIVANVDMSVSSDLSKFKAVFAENKVNAETSILNLDKKILRNAMENKVLNEPLHSFFDNNRLLSRNILNALERLQNIDNTKLEQLFFEHLDVLSYRWDACISGITYYKLLKKRKDFQIDLMSELDSTSKIIKVSSRLTENKGLYYGAYGYLEDVAVLGNPNDHFVKREEQRWTELNKNIIFKELSENEITVETQQKMNACITDLGNKKNIENAWIYLGKKDREENFKFYFRTVFKDNSLLIDPYEDEDNLGFIPAPSLDHATTAAILKSGYNHQVEQKKGYGLIQEEVPFATNLNSKRVRRALFYIEGLQNGQELAQLIGYRFERELKNHKTKLEKYIPYFRKAFPFKLERAEINTAPVVNGLALIEMYRNVSEVEFTKFVANGGVVKDEKPIVIPFLNWDNNAWENWNNNVQVSFPEDIKILIIPVIEKINDDLDGLNDLMNAEGVFQIVRGNMERAAAALNSISGNAPIHRPQIQDIKKEGFPITHTVGLILDHETIKNTWSDIETPLSKLSPQINKWLSHMLPAPYKIIINIKWRENIELDDWEERTIRLSNLKLQPIDFIYMVMDNGLTTTSGELLFRVESYLLNLAEYDGLTTIGNQIQLVEKQSKDSEEYAIHDIYPLLENLYKILTEGRALEPNDFSILLKEDGKINNLSAKLSLLHEISTLLNIIEHAKTNLGLLLGEIEEYIGDNDTMNIALDIATSRKIELILLNIARFRLSNAIPSNRDVFKDITLLQNHLKSVFKKLKETIDNLTPLKVENIRTFNELKEAVNLIYGKGVLVIPSVKNPNTDTFEASPATERMLNNNDPFEIEKWIQSLAPVSPRMAILQRWDQLISSVNLSTINKCVYQFPLRGNPDDDYWFGLRFDKKDYLDDGKRNDLYSYVFFSLKDKPKINTTIHAIVLDQWTESIPYKEKNLAVAMHYDQASNEPPQTVLLATSNTEKDNWDWEELMDSISETFDLAKMRLKGPNASNQSHHGFLPFLIAPQYLGKDKSQSNLGSMIPRNTMPVTPSDNGLNKT